MVLQATMSVTISFFSLPQIHAASLNTLPLLKRGKMLPSQQWAQLPSSICTFGDQFSASKPPVPPIVKTMPPAAEPPNDMHHTTKNVPNPCRPDSNLGDLDKQFDPQLCSISTNAEVVQLCSRVVDNHEKSQHVMFCGSAESYIMNDLQSHLHSFENGSTMLNPQTTPVPCNYYLQGVDFFSDSVSVGIFNESFKDTQLCLPTLIKFVLQLGEIDKFRNADTALDKSEAPVQCWQITFGCCGQDWQGSKVDDVNMPSPTYGLHKFKNCVDPNEGSLVQMMVATLRELSGHQPGRGAPLALLPPALLGSASQ
jgi:hypothetical protein